MIFWIMQYKMDIPDISLISKIWKAEEEFHDTFAKEIKITDINIAHFVSSTVVPQNIYALKVLGDVRDKKLLEIGCGAGEFSVYFALKGAKVTSIDISSGMLNKSKELSRHYEVENKISFIKSAAEIFKPASGYYDIIFGQDILHHTNIPMVIKQMQTILSPSGKMVFIETLQSNIFVRLYRLLSKNLRTSSEKPLTFSDVNNIKVLFNSFKHQEFQLTTQIIYMYFALKGHSPSKTRYWKLILANTLEYKKLFSILSKLDNIIMRTCPLLRRACLWTVIECSQ